MSRDGPQRTRPNILVTGTPGTGKTTLASLIAVRRMHTGGEIDSQTNSTYRLHSIGIHHHLSPLFFVFFVGIIKLSFAGAYRN